MVQLRTLHNDVHVMTDPVGHYADSQGCLWYVRALGAWWGEREQLVQCLEFLLLRDWIVKLLFFVWCHCQEPFSETLIGKSVPFLCPARQSGLEDLRCALPPIFPESAGSSCPLQM